jgi:hypothetical protein
MDDFTRQLGVSLIHLLWQVSGCPDAEDDSAAARRDVISEVVERLRGESLDNDSDLEQLIDAVSEVRVWAQLRRGVTPNPPTAML